MIRWIIFLGLNLAALGLGAWLMGASPAENDWYISLQKAPWTPPGWVFGAAWLLIMICFSVFLWKSTGKENKHNLMHVLVAFGIQWLLNVSWNPIFFAWHLPVLALIILFSLFVLVFFWNSYAFRKFGFWGLLLLPYTVWLCIALSLNAYVLFVN